MSYLVGISATKKELAPTPKFPAHTLPAPSPLVPPPPGIFNKKPASSWRLGPPLPLPRTEKNREYSKRPPRLRFWYDSCEHECHGKLRDDF